MKAKMTVYQKGGKVPPKKIPAHLTTDAAKLSKTPSEIELTKVSFDQAKQMKDYKSAGRVGADQSGIFEEMKVTNKRAYELEKKAAAERSAKEKAREAFMKKYEKGGKMNVAGAKGEDQYKYLGYGKGGKMPVYSKGGMAKYLKGGQVKLDKNMDGKITGVDFKMMAKKK